MSASGNNSNNTDSPVLLPSGPIFANFKPPPSTLVNSLNWYWFRLILFAQLVALALFAHLLYFAQFRGKKLLRDRNLKPTIQLYILFHSIGILSSIPGIVVRAFSLVDATESNISLYFWLWAPNYNYNLCISPFFVFFLTVERLLIIRFHLRMRIYRVHFLLVVILATILLYCFSFAFFIAELPLDPKIALSSFPLIRIVPKFMLEPQSWISASIGVCNLFLILLFLCWMRNSFPEMGQKIKFRVVRFTGICELLFNCPASFANLLADKLTGNPLNLYIGVYQTAIMNVDTMICAIFYTWIYLYVAKREMERESKALSAVKRSPIPHRHAPSNFKSFNQVAPF